MITASFVLDVSYSQIVIFPKSMENPYNHWTQRHSDQGFAWRPGCVAFGALTEGGSHLVEVSVVDHAGDVAGDVIRAIEVPFEVPVDDDIEVSGVSGLAFVSVPPGGYLLRCEFLPPAGDDEGRVRLIFARKDKPRFAVVRADEEISIGDGLLTTAEPAAP